MPSSVHPSKNSGDYQNNGEGQTRQFSGLPQLHSASSYELGPHPADPHSTVLPVSTNFSSSSISDHSNFAPSAIRHEATNRSVEGNGSREEHRFGPGTCTERVPGQELWVYGGQGRFVILTPIVNLVQYF